MLSATFSSLLAGSSCTEPAVQDLGMGQLTGIRVSLLLGRGSCE